MAAVIRSIDLAAFRAGGAAARDVAETFDRAGRETGFLTIRNHAIAPGLIERAFAEATRFFAQPQAFKAALGPETPQHFNGYFGQGSERTGNLYGGSDRMHLREKFMISRPVPSQSWDPAQPEIGWPYQPNRWPDLPGFADAYLALYAAMERVAADTVRVAAAALGLEKTALDAHFERHESTMSWMHYPPQPEPPAPDQVRSPAHSDVGSMTFLIQDQGVDGRHPGGLQILLDDGSWTDIDPVPGTILMNVGDTLRRWTNDRWRSSKHRVANPPRELAHTARISLGFFQKPDFHAPLEPLPGCADAANPPRYAPMRAGEYMRYRMLHSVGDQRFAERVREPALVIA